MDIILKKEIDKLIVENNLSKLKELLYEKLITSKSSSILELLALVEGALGNFRNSLKLLNRVENKTEIGKKYLSFILEEIKPKYLLKYNQLIQKIQNNEGIEDLVKELEELAPNVSLFELLSLYYLDKGNFSKSKEYIQKGLLIDKFNEKICKIESYILEKETKSLVNTKKSKASLVLLLVSLAAISFGIYEKQKGIKIEGNNSNNLVLMEKMKKDLELEKKNIKEVTITKYKEVKVEEKIIKEKEIVETRDFIVQDFSAREIFNKGMSLRKRKKYEQALKYFEVLTLNSEDTIYKREAIFWLGRSYEDTGEIEKAKQTYNMYLQNYLDISNYKQEIKNRLRKLGE